MTKIRYIIESLWLVILFTILLFGIPLVFCFGIYGMIFQIIFLLSLWLGYRLAKKQSSWLYRIIIVSVFGFIGYFVGYYAAAAFFGAPMIG